MLVFWWSGRGYFTPIILLATLSLFGVLLQAGRSIIADRPWLWGIALLAAAALNWHFGSKANRKKLAVLKPKSTRERLLYRARHCFMSLPMESFSVIVAVSGLAIIAYSLFWPA